MPKDSLGHDGFLLLIRRSTSRKINYIYFFE